MFEDYKRLTDREGTHIMCANCRKFHDDCSDSLDCMETLSQKLSQFENALDDGLLVELTEERITALMACLHAASTNRRMIDATYVKFQRDSGGKIHTLREMRYDKAIDVLADLLEKLSDKKEVTEK